MTPIDDNEALQSLFANSPDAIWLLDPGSRRFVECNEAALRLLATDDRSDIIGRTPMDLAPELQPDGRPTTEHTREIIDEVEGTGCARFEWIVRRIDGVLLPTAVVITRLVEDGRSWHLVMAQDITEHREAEEAVRRLNLSLEQRIIERTAELSASEARLRTLVEHAPEAIVVFDGETGRFTVCNQHATRLYGLAEEKLLECRPEDVSPPRQPDGRPSPEAAREWIRRAVAGEAPVFEWMHQHSDGRLIPCEVRLVRLPSEGRILVRGSVTDTSERRRRERVQRAIYEISEAAHAADDLDELFAHIHGTIRELMPADNFYIALHEAETGTITFPYHVDRFSPPPEPRRVTTGLTGEVIRLAKPLLVNRDMERLKKPVGDGVVIEGVADLPYVESGPPAAIWLGVPLMLGGRPSGVMAVQDYDNPQAYGDEEMQILSFIAGQTALAISRRRTEDAMRQSEQKFRALFEATSQGVMLHDEHRFLEVNPVIPAMFGYADDSAIIGRRPSELAPPFQPDGEPSAEAARRHVKACLDKGSTRFDWSVLNARGETLLLDVILTRIDLRDRPIIQAVVDDITERKKAEAELRRALHREKELGALKNSFVSMVSHEFRTPLGVISTSAEILRDYLDRLGPAERQEHLLSITRNTRRMANLMEEVLVLGRLDAGKMVFEPAPLPLASVCLGLTEEVLSATDRVCPISLRFDSLPGEAHADEKLLRHIVTNLLSNAVKYSPRGAEVEFRLGRQGGHAVLTIRDHGIGIPPEDQPALFEAFRRGSNVGQRPGTGLGLVIVRRCVELHHGRIDLRSEPGQGTTVTVELPCFVDA